MPLFPHEIIEKQRKENEQELQTRIKAIPEMNIYYDIQVLAENYGFTSTEAYNYLALFTPENCTKTLINQMLDEIEEDVLFDWEVDTDRTKRTFQREEYHYTNPNKPFTIEIDIVISQCKIIETGRKIPETKTVCNLPD